MIVDKPGWGLYFYRLIVIVSSYGCSDVRLGAFYFLKGVIDALFCGKEAEGEDHQAEKDYFVDRFHLP